MDMMPYYVYVRNNTGWHVAKHYPKDQEYYLPGNEFPYKADWFDYIGERVELPKGDE